MRVQTQAHYDNDGRVTFLNADSNAQIFLYFMSPEYENRTAYIAAVRDAYPNARLIGCTTGGEIFGDEAVEKSTVSAAIKLECSQSKIVQTQVANIDESYAAGQILARELNDPSLKLIFVLSDGLLINGSELVRGITENSHQGILVVGGLAGDGANFKKTRIAVDGNLLNGGVAAIGFYGDKIKAGYGSAGGWRKLGPERKITKSKGNVIYELDGLPALNLYKKYLGEEASQLPSSGTRFPLGIRPTTASEHEVVRGTLGIDEKDNSLIFAGNMPEGYIAQLMQGSHDNLTEGSERAGLNALECFHPDENHSDTLGILISCVGRKMVMGQRISNEVEAAKNVLGDIPLVGFYSHGEICPHSITGENGFHNQTMTITLLSESV
jgi:hypothetical protein